MCHLWTLGYKVATQPFNGVSIEKIQSELKKADLPEDGKIQLFDGRTGEAFQEKTAVGSMYIIKLHHMIADKIHARSIGPYTMVTQQPLGGKAQNGGQRFGEMEVWALEAYGAATTLQEMLTIKSDDVYGRAKAYEAIIKNEPITGPKIPESFNVLVKELQGLGLRVDLVDESEEDAVIDAENIIALGTEGSGVSAQDIATEVPAEDAFVGDEADEFGDIELEEGMSIETAEEFVSENEEGEEA
ncbi:hypothetical protein B7Z17_02555 [Candidatus Saccharibacteria bacterium 32-49-10]|nr:MAG: hypothetical protein B7Z17_02555 [Candidatus Saccharibacteria bacterium 32-49-10]